MPGKEFILRRTGFGDAVCIADEHIALLKVYLAGIISRVGPQADSRPGGIECFFYAFGINQVEGLMTRIDKIKLSGIGIEHPEKRVANIPSSPWVWAM